MPAADVGPEVEWVFYKLASATHRLIFLDSPILALCGTYRKSADSQF
ncbi:hypothetical protein [Microcoleus sp. Pol11C3]